MNNTENSSEIFNRQIDPNNQINDYQYLILRLENIKEGIAFLENNFFVK